MRHYLSFMGLNKSRQRGMTVPFLAFSFIALTGFVGSAIDIARVQLVQSRLSFSTDAAGLAAGATLNTANIETEVNKYIDVNFPAGYLGAAEPSVSVTTSDNNMVIDVMAQTTVPTIFMRLLGQNSVTVTASSQITRTASGLELVMVLDNTGSMSGTKLTNLKTAATTLVSILYGGQTTVRNLWIGLVPFSDVVNIGSTRTDWIDTDFHNALNWSPTSWGGCVDAREQYGRDITDDPPSVEKFKDFYYVTCTAAGKYTNVYGTEYNYPTSGGNCTVKYTYYGITYTPKTLYNLYCPQPVQPMTGNRTTITTAINNMGAAGNTHIAGGLAWGWRMLSPRWQGLWGGEMDSNGLPLAYNAPHMNKAVILLSDGENTHSNGVYTAYGFLQEGRTGSSNSSAAFTALNNKMLSVCNSLKYNGVYVYTIALDVSGDRISEETKALLKSCASSENYYFYSPSATDLQSVFSSIGDSLSNLRVSR